MKSPLSLWERVRVRAIGFGVFGHPPISRNALTPGPSPKARGETLQHSGRQSFSAAAPFFLRTCVPLALPVPFYSTIFRYAVFHFCHAKYRSHYPRPPNNGKASGTHTKLPFVSATPAPSRFAGTPAISFLLPEFLNQSGEFR